MTELVGKEVETIVREHAGFVYQVALGVLRNHHDAEDVVQETFIRVTLTWKSLSEIRDMRAWLARICWRLAVTKRKKSRPVPEFHEVPQEFSSADPETLAGSREVLSVIESLIDSLPEEIKDPLVLSAIDGMSSGEISQILGIPGATVRTRIFRARKILQEKLHILVGGNPC